MSLSGEESSVKTVLYITYNYLGDRSSGSGVRPYAMYKAFLERGYEVKVLSGFCGRGWTKEEIG